MSIRASERLRLSLSVIGLVGLIYVVWTASLQALARQAETKGGVYPYKQEDWLRYLLPTLWPDEGRPLLLLTGPSTVRENLLIEEFAAAFPDHRIFQGGLSAGTLADVMASLEYVERAHGRGALPSIIVLGVSPRFIAEIPDGRPFALGLDRYSRRFRVTGEDPTGFGLVRKSDAMGTVDHLRFMIAKQRPRYRTALAWLLAKAVGPDLSDRLSGSTVARGLLRPWARLFVSGRAVDVGIHDYALEIASPYKYRDTQPYAIADLSRWLEHPASWWGDVHRWDPAADDAVIRERVAALLDFCERHGIELYVVNLPEREASRIRYEPEFTRRYDALIQSVFGRLPLLDLRCLLEDHEFLDAEHALPDGARRVTERVIGFMKSAGAQGGAGENAGRPTVDIPARWASSCPGAP